MMNDPFARLAAIREKQKMFPGRAPGGSGATGLLSNDARGWSDVLNEQTEAENIERELAGEAPLGVKRGGNFGGMAPGLAADPAWWSQGLAQGPMAPTAQSMPLALRGMMPMPDSHDEFMAKRPKGKK